VTVAMGKARRRPANHGSALVWVQQKLIFIIV
jgi:hypothetical protein